MLQFLLWLTFVHVVMPSPLFLLSSFSISICGPDYTMHPASEIDGNDLSNGSADYLNHGNKKDFLNWLKAVLVFFQEYQIIFIFI